MTTQTYNSNANAKLSFIEKAGFGAGDAACNMLFNPITMFLSFFYTDIFGLAPAIVATMFLIVRCIDAVFDPLYGAFIDKTHTRHGTYRPWMILMAIPFAISCMIMFYTPDISGTAKVAYAFGTYLLLSILYSAVNVPYCSLATRLSADLKERVSMQKFRFVGAGLASIFCTMTLLPLVNYLGGGDRQLGFFYVVSLFAIISLVLFAFCFFSTTERVQPQHEQNLTLVESFKRMCHNDQWFVCMSLMFLDCMPSFIRGAASIYFAKYVLGFGDAGATAFLAAGIIANIVGAGVTDYLTNRWCKVTVYKAVKSICIVLSLILLIIPSSQLALIWVVFIVLSVIHQIGAPIIWSFISDVDDYGEYKLGQRASGLCASGNLFTLKVALGVGGALVGYVLAQSGYEANVAEQTDSAVHGIYALMTWIPAIFYFITFVVTHWFYKLNRTKMQEINTALFVNKN